MLYLGLDPGVDGALVIVDEHCRVEAADFMPTLEDGPKGRRLVDTETLAALLAAHHPITMGALERIGTAPGVRMGAASAITIGRNFGRLEDRLASLRIPFALVQAQAWQRVLCPGSGDPKARSVAACRRMLPGLDLTPGRRRVPHDGLADAGLLAVYAMRVLANVQAGAAVGKPS